jgi:VWFA-related protein
VRDIVLAGALALITAGAAAQQQGATSTAVPEAPQQQNIPDAPRPQSSTFGPVTPGKGVTASTSAATPADPNAPGATLPSTPTAQAAEPTTPPSDLEIPTGGQTGPALQRLYLRSTFVDVPFTVKDNKGHLVAGITWRDVRVYENGLRQHMSVFIRDPVPLSVALVIDQSLTPDTMERVNSSLAALQGAFSPYDEVEVFTYNHGVQKQDGFDAGQGARLAAVLERSKSTGVEPMYYAAGEGLGGGININNGAELNQTPLSAGTGRVNGHAQNPERESHTLNDAILAAAKATSRVGRDRRRVVYVISDGKEYGSVAKQKEVIKYLQTNNVTVYATLVGDSSVEGLGFLDKLHIPLQMRDNVLPAYTSATGGQTYAEFRTRGIETSFARVTDEVRNQYSVGYYSTEPSVDGKFRKIEVQIMRPNLQVLAKDGYYPAAEPIRGAAGTAPTETSPNP